MTPVDIFSKTVPLYKVVGGSVIDLHEDLGRYEHRLSHWAVRGLKKLTRETLRPRPRKAILKINVSAKTAVLPIDIDDEEPIGIYMLSDDGIKIPVTKNGALVDIKNVEEIECEDKCEKCNQDKSICKGMEITDEVTLVIVNNAVEEQVVTKKLYPDGSYYLETRIPMIDVESGMTVYSTTKEYVTKFDLKPCGCLEESASNIEKLKCCCYDLYCNYYAPCDNSCAFEISGYKVFPETGIIQFGKIGNFKKCYVEYYGFLVKKKGQYHVPEVAFETLVNFTKFKQVENKRNVPLGERQWTFNQYLRERDNMERVIGRVSLGDILELIGRPPKFDFSMPDLGCGSFTHEVETADVDSDCDSNQNTTTMAGCVPCSPTAAFIPYSVSVIAGIAGGPVAGTNVYQDDKLKNAIGITHIIVNNANETEKNLQYELDTVAGTITRFQADGTTANLWFAGDILIIPNFFKA